MPKPETDVLLEGDIKAAVIEMLAAAGHLSFSKYGTLKLLNIIRFSTFPSKVITADLNNDGWEDLVVANGHIHAFEIKSASDSLKRLSGQVETYLRFFDKVTLVVAERHEKNTLISTPNSVAVWRINEAGNISVVRRGRRSEIRDRESLIRLLRMKDLKAALRESGVSPLPSSRKELEKAASALPVNHIRRYVLAIIKERYAPTTQLFWKKVGAGPICSSHLESLSPFLAVRRRIEKEARLLEDQRETWIKSLPDDFHLARWAKLMPPEPFGPVPAHIHAKLLLA